MIFNEHFIDFKNKYRFNAMELSGSLGDLGLFIPLVVAVCIVCKLDIGVVLILAGLMNILTGIIFGQPIPVQPMKALATIAIAEGLIRDELLAAGILMGIILVLSSGIIDKINKWVPVVVVRGIQIGVGAKLVFKALQWIGELPFWGLDSVGVALSVILFLLFVCRRKWPSLLFIFLIGILILSIKHPDTFRGYEFSLPVFHFYIPKGASWYNGFFRGVIAQLPLTLLNSVVAVCALSEDYFPGKGIQPKKMAFSVGLMNILCVPFGGIPMCHGAGGLAAQYSFGARGAGSVAFLGFLKILVGLLFGGILLSVLANYPMAVLAPMLLFAGGQLLKNVKFIKDNRRHLFIAIMMTGLILVFNTAIGFLAGLMSAILLNEARGKEIKQ